MGYGKRDGLSRSPHGNLKISTCEDSLGQENMSLKEELGEYNDR
jgi:hypothetical protein